MKSRQDHWVNEIVWWHVYPLGFTDAEQQIYHDPNRIENRLVKLENWLGYVRDLGCNGLLLAPIFTAETHGYDTVDHFQIDRRLGTLDDFQRFLAACRNNNIRVTLDGVFNHVGRGFSAFQDVLQHRQNSRYANWFHINWNDHHNADGFSYRNFEGHHQLVTLNHSNPEVIDYIVEVMIYWLVQGIDGWRLDAAYSMPQTAWKAIVERVREKFPHVWFLGEVIHGDYANFSNQTEIQSVTQYELWKAIWSGLNDRNLFELSHSLSRHKQFISANLLPNIFIGNHDVTRIASQLKDKRHLAHAVTVLLTMPGTPSIYYGDEQAFTGRKEKRPGGDDAIRPAFPDDPNALSVLGRETFSLYQKLVHFRTANSWIANASLNVVTTANQNLTITVEGDGHKLLVALNISDQSVTVSDHLKTNLHLLDGDVLEVDGSVKAHACALWFSS